MLQPRPAARFAGGFHLHVRVHVLPRLLDRGSEGSLPELRWRIGRAAAPTADKLAKYPASTERIYKPAGCGKAA
jgi:hypothetical protein